MGPDTETIICPSAMCGLVYEQVADVPEMIAPRGCPRCGTVPVEEQE